MVLVRSLVRNAVPAASSSLPPVAWAHAARMFHRAEPDEPGFGVMISTPGSTMSSQVS